MLKIIIDLIRLIVSTLIHSRKDLFLYIAALQKENEILKRKLDSRKQKIKFNNNDRIFFAAINLISRKIDSFISLVKPKTVLKWYRRLIKKFWTFPSWTNKGGRPLTPVHIRNLILEMKNNNLLWGNGKIKGELLKLGIKLDKRTIARILNYFRKKGKVKNVHTWKKFIKSHFDSLFAMDFFTVDSISNKRYYIFFIIYLKTREIVYFDITISYRSPNLNAFAERFVGSIRREALDWFVIFTKKQLRKILKEFIYYYNLQRHHQGIDNIPAGYIPQREGKIISESVLFGLHNHYYRKTA